MLTVISLICAMVSVMPPIEVTASLVEACMAATCAEISSVAFAVWLAKAFTSEAPTGKPRPGSPARAASMVAFSASKLVCAAMLWINFTTSPIFSAPVESAPTVALVRSASPTALLAISLERATWREISLTELDSSSAAAATVPTLFDELSDAAPTVAARALASLAVAVIDWAVVCMPAAAGDTEQPRDRLHLGVEIVEIGAGAEIHVEAGNGDGIAHLADRLFLAGLHIFIEQQDRAVGLDAVHQFHGQLAAVGHDVHAVGADLLGVGRHHRDAVIRSSEQVTRTLVIGHRIGALAEFLQRGLLGHLPGIDLLLQAGRHIEA